MIQINNVMYRYDNKVYQPGDIIDGPPRNIHQTIIDMYSSMTGFDFNQPYVYMNPTRNQDDSWHESYYIYEVLPIGPYAKGNDTYSIDICNDKYLKRYKTANPSESVILDLARKMCNNYVANKSNTSIVAHKCKVVRRIHIGGENDEKER